jgi:hypothetical protein
MSKSKKRNGQCVYCGQIGPITYDHVPPQNLFGLPKPTNLIKVPSCFKCNNEASKDDEYFRFTISLRDDISQNPIVQKLIPGVIRSLTIPKKEGFKKAIFSNIRESNQSLGSINPHKQKLIIDVDLLRLNRVAVRIVKGLFFYEKGYRIPDGYYVEAYEQTGIANLTIELLDWFKTKFLPPLLAVSPRIIDINVFSYRVAFAEDDTNFSLWMLIFFQKIIFLAITADEKYRPLLDA